MKTNNLGFVKGGLPSLDFFTEVSNSVLDTVLSPIIQKTKRNYSFFSIVFTGIRKINMWPIKNLFTVMEIQSSLRARPERSALGVDPYARCCGGRGRKTSGYPIGQNSKAVNLNQLLSVSVVFKLLSSTARTRLIVGSCIGGNGPLAVILNICSLAAL